MNLTPPSSMDFPSAAIEILVVVSGARFRQTAIFTHSPRDDCRGPARPGRKVARRAAGRYLPQPLTPVPSPATRERGMHSIGTVLPSYGHSAVDRLPIFPNGQTSR